MNEEIRDNQNDGNSEETKSVKKITHIKKKDINRLNPLWFKKVCGLAIKYGTTIQITKDGTVFGYSSRSSSTAVFFDSTEEGAKEWIDEILKISPKGAVFPHTGIIFDRDVQNVLRSYANAPTQKTDENRKLCAYAWFDSVTKTLHMKADGVTIKTGAIVETEPCIPQHIPNFDIPDMVLRDLIPKNKLAVLTNCLSKDETRKNLKRIYPEKYKYVNAVVGTDGRKLCMFVNANLPDDLSIEPSITPPLEIDGYKSIRICERDKEGNDVYLRTVRFFKMNDGVVMSETLEDEFPKNTHVIVSSAENVEYGGSVQPQSLTNVLSSIKLLGLVDCDGKNILVFMKDKIAVRSNGADLAVFDADVSLPDGIEVYYSYEVLKNVSELGVIIHQPTIKHNGSICSPLFAKTDDCYFVAMPLKFS